MDTREETCAGGVLYRHGEPGIEFLVGEQIDWRTKARTVRLAKGHLEPDEPLERGALREVEEETGRRARIAGLLGEHRYAFDAPAREHRPGGRIEKRVVFFLMEDLGPHPDGRDDEMEAVHWLDADAACARLTFENEQAMVRSAAARLAGAAAGSLAIEPTKARS